MVLAMVGLFLATGVGQDPLQFIHPATEYAALLQRGPAALRACLVLDCVFIACYTTLFAVLAIVLVRGGTSRLLVGLALGLLLVLALLDTFENLHFLVMLDRVELGISPSATEIELQVWGSLVKFHISYLGMFVLGCALPRHTLAQRVLATMALLQLPLGAAIYAVPRAVATPLVFARFTYFVAALVLIARIFGRTGSGSGAPASRPGTTPGGAG